ncbi:MAG: ABC transporter substrate-binding protein [Actinomycetia bacterium]|nr:ABC transporter substrate-binding protein [Actinomycetes bacterium]
MSLVPSVTETLLDWGIEPVACTRFCEQPDLVHVGGTKDPDVEAIAALGADLVVLDAEENRREDYDALLGAGLDVVALRVRSVQDVGHQLEPLAARLGVQWVMGEIPAGVATSASAFVPIWKRPWMALGSPTYGTSLLEHIGVGNVFADHEVPYPETTLEAASDLGPDLVIAPSEPYPFAERHRAELESVAPAVFVDGKDLVWWGSRTAGAIRRLSALSG